MSVWTLLLAALVLCGLVWVFFPRALGRVLEALWDALTWVLLLRWLDDR